MGVQDDKPCSTSCSSVSPPCFALQIKRRWGSNRLTHTASWAQRWMTVCGCTFFKQQVEFWKLCCSYISASAWAACLYYNVMNLRHRFHRRTWNVYDVWDGLSFKTCCCFSVRALPAIFMMSFRNFGASPEIRSHKCAPWRRLLLKHPISIFDICSFNLFIIHSSLRSVNTFHFLAFCVFLYCVTVHCSHVPAHTPAGALPGPPASHAATSTGDDRQHGAPRSARWSGPHCFPSRCQHTAFIFTQAGCVWALSQIQGLVRQQA